MLDRALLHLFLYGYPGSGKTKAVGDFHKSGQDVVIIAHEQGEMTLDTTLVMAQTGSYTWASDLDGDGDLDLSVVDEAADSLYIFYNGDTPTGVGPAPEAARDIPAGLSLRVFPNPVSSSGTRIYFEAGVAGPGGATVGVYTVGGRLVRSLSAAGVSPTGFDLHWDGRDGDGRPVAPGIYLIGVESHGGRISRRVQVIR